MQRENFFYYLSLAVKTSLHRHCRKTETGNITSEARVELLARVAYARFFWIIKLKNPAQCCQLFSNESSVHH